jgi:hypothetical protein
MPCTLRRAEAKVTRDRQDLEVGKQEIRRKWENSCVEYAFECIPGDAPEDLRLPVSEFVREALTPLAPSDPPEVSARLISAAVEKTIRPWRVSRESLVDVSGDLIVRSLEQSVARTSAIKSKAIRP